MNAFNEDSIDSIDFKLQRIPGLKDKTYAFTDYSKLLPILKKCSKEQSLECFDRELKHKVEKFAKEGTLGIIKKLRHFHYLRILHQTSEIQTCELLAELKKSLGLNKDIELFKALREVLTYKKVGKFDMKNKAFHFIDEQDSIDHRGMQCKLEFNLKLMKRLLVRYNEAHEKIIHERIRMPNTIFT